ncbi:hypothetical protein BDZ90DRAFT_142814 [Jaminaea rosea]|uniref:BHLH domain-containing protein n=1 Tax=Jaminaea rosea TaxID=1569628 RepID=A0A316USH8_9BASI|nr:hypothetical protein BDZ90DRAFT_142814 [Jaminaea rosea]PWN28247.1 hypothetical protein BDZ90DRAFT_142814 [Jaminaea rosea]
MYSPPYPHAHASSSSSFPYHNVAPRTPLPLPPIIAPPMGLFSPSADAAYRPAAPAWSPASSSSSPSSPSRAAYVQSRAQPTSGPARGAARGGHASSKAPGTGTIGQGGSTPAAMAGSKVKSSSSTSRDSKRRATHSQIERRRREKINARLITLRNLVPACLRTIQDPQQEEQEGDDGDQWSSSRASRS